MPRAWPPAQYSETSAKEGNDVEEPFKQIAAAIKKNFDQQHSMPGDDDF